MKSYNKEKLLKFINEARTKTSKLYDQGGFIRMFSDLKTYPGFEYENKCYGGMTFFGNETALFEDAVVWMNNYSGGVFPDEIEEAELPLEKIISFVRESRVMGEYGATTNIKGDWVYSKVLDVSSQLGNISVKIRKTQGFPFGISTEYVLYKGSLIFICVNQSGFPE